MPSAKDFTGGDLLSTRNFGPKQRKLKVVGVGPRSIKQLDGRVKTKLVLRFGDEVKGLALNTTNVEAMSIAYGDDYDKWVGKEVVVFRDTDTFDDEEVECLRIKAVK